MNSIRLRLTFLFILILSFTLHSCNRSIEPVINYYKKNGKQWYQKKIYCYPDGKYPSTKGPRKLAMVQQFKGTILHESKVFYELWPNGECRFVSNEGFYKYRNGESQLFGDSISIPDNIIVELLDSNNNTATFYYKDGKRVPYNLGKMDGVQETIYEGDKPGVYKWKNGKRVFIRELNQAEIESKNRLEKMLNEGR